MPSLDGYELPEAIVRELQRVVREADDDRLLDAAKPFPDLFKGGRPTRAGLPFMRQRLILLLVGAGPVTDEVCTVLASLGLNNEFVSVFSEEALEIGMGAFADIYGRDRLLAAMLMDARPIVRLLAREALEEEALPETADAARGRKTVLSAFALFLNTLRAWGDPAQPQSPASSLPGAAEPPQAARIAQLEQELAEARTKRAHERSLQQKVERLNETLAAREREVAALREEAQAARRQGAADAAAARAAAQALTDEQAAANERVRAGVAATLAADREAWLAPARAIAEEAARLRTELGRADVLVEAEAVLLKQAELDRHCGNLRLLRERAAALQAMCARLRQAQQEALHPLPALAELAARVEREGELIVARLPAAPEATSGELDVRLRAALNTAPDEQELHRLRLLLTELDERSLLPADELRRLYADYHRAMLRHYALRGPGAPQAAGGTARHPVWRLRQAPAQTPPLLLLVDGYNVLHLLPALFGAAGEKDGRPGAAARRLLMEKVARLVRGAPQCETRVCFDGPSPQELTHAPNLREVYSGGGRGAHRADGVILKHLEYSRSRPGAPACVLVTDDRALAAEARGLGARIMSVAEFGACLDAPGA